MKNVFNKKKWSAGVVQLHVDPPPTPLIKIKHDDKSDKNFVNIKLRMDKTSKKSDLYELKMALFENDKPEYFFNLFVIST